MCRNARITTEDDRGRPTLNETTTSIDLAYLEKELSEAKLKQKTKIKFQGDRHLNQETGR